MSRITYRGPDRFTPRSRTAAQRQNEGRFAEAMRFRRGTVGALMMLVIAVGLAVFA